MLLNVIHFFHWHQRKGGDLNWFRGVICHVSAMEEKENKHVQDFVKKIRWRAMISHQNQTHRYPAFKRLQGEQERLMLRYSWYHTLCSFGNNFKITSCCCSVTQSCLTLSGPMDCSKPGFPVLHYLLEFAQIHVHWCHPTISSSVALFFFCPQSFPVSGTELTVDNLLRFGSLWFRYITFKKVSETKLTFVLIYSLIFMG